MISLALDFLYVTTLALYTTTEWDYQRLNFGHYEIGHNRKF